jgi:hypothetical protein
MDVLVLTVMCALRNAGHPVHPVHLFSVAVKKTDIGVE